MKTTWERNNIYENLNIKYEGDLINGKREEISRSINKGGKYYIGEWKNDLEYGKGILYYKNGNIKYEGDYINGKFEGKGKYIYEDGAYYIGQWKNVLEHGKCIEYCKDGKKCMKVIF